MNVKEWLHSQCSPEFVVDMRAYHNLDLWMFTRFAEEAGIEDDMDGIDVRVYCESEYWNDKPYARFMFQWKRDGKILYETWLETKRYWPYELSRFKEVNET